MKVIYTEAADQEMMNFHQQQKETLEKLVAEKKVVFGDEVLEITASDIKEASRNIRPLLPISTRFGNAQILTKIYVALGVLMMVGAIYYPRFEILFAENRNQGLLFLTGAGLTLIGLVANSYIVLRKRKHIEAVRALESISRKDLQA